ncbi:MAG TPA: hypothetical protein VFV94_03725 [Polyangiaceae bacterium]|nr:hypothetical protein [Polyangiaceae bacterium]
MLSVLIADDSLVMRRMVARSLELGAQLAADMLCVDASDEQAVAQAGGAGRHPRE